ncbi:hypothetical protein ACFQ14_05500 [Pseudahrensia aquimaris]|uniref:Uncharacterized protein n=1 Tax=Pseudahrensia aquimaris TaxID=744461 RepID=A0ABW3FBN4_9HYPH
MNGIVAYLREHNAFQTALCSRICFNVLLLSVRDQVIGSNERHSDSLAAIGIVLVQALRANAEQITLTKTSSLCLSESVQSAPRCLPSRLLIGQRAFAVLGKQAEYLSQQLKYMTER